jgi:putative ABC transport system substrate-binding protein
MRRRTLLIAIIGADLLQRTVRPRAQQLRRIGYLGFGAGQRSELFHAFAKGLEQLGWVEGKNLEIEDRWGATNASLNSAANELAKANVEVIFATSSLLVEAARQAAPKTPIVFATHADPVGVGHVASLPRPGGNITGLSMLLTEIVAKELEVLTEALPGSHRIGVMWEPNTPSHGPAVNALRGAGEVLRLDLIFAPTSTPDDFEVALREFHKEAVDALLVIGANVNYVHRALLAELSLKYQLPTVFAARENVLAGGLMSYGPNYHHLHRQAAAYVDRILKGAAPADLPVEQASRYTLAINLKTASALGLTIPPTLLARADEVIE